MAGHVKIEGLDDNGQRHRKTSFSAVHTSWAAQLDKPIPVASGAGWYSSCFDCRLGSMSQVLSGIQLPGNKNEELVIPRLLLATTHSCCTELRTLQSVKAHTNRIPQ